MKILIFCPLNPAGPRIFARSLQSIFDLAWSGPLEMLFGKNDYPAGKKNQDLNNKHEQARLLALKGNYDALLMVEADMILPENTLDRLSQVQADVAYGLYCSRRGHYQWLAYSKLAKLTGESIDKNRKFCAENWGNVIPTKGVGMGCTLIRRKVLEKIPFRIIGPAADDWYFALDCEYHGFTQAHDLGVICGHIVNDPGQERKVVYPTLETEQLYRFEAL